MVFFVVRTVWFPDIFFFHYSEHQFGFGEQREGALLELGVVCDDGDEGDEGPILAFQCSTLLKMNDYSGFFHCCDIVPGIPWPYLRSSVNLLSFPFFLT